ncbi:hypothetical protein G8G18_004456 [Vibrio parahaemolyticus]|nr:hypothetical protein [Vibrio parahaemolyticus]MBY8244554.1 hypothetical protein [Vibrio fluvialis]
MNVEPNVICTYLSQRQRLSIQQLINAKVIVDSEQEPTHIQGWCASTSSPRTLRVDHVLEVHDSFDEAQAFFKEAEEKLKEAGFEFQTKSPTRLSSPDTMDVCFTGFSKADKTELANLANEKNMMVRQSVTKHLDILCYGYNAGPKKLESALSQGVMILNRNQFENLLATGEVPEEI